jgi:hypothetical protein
MTFREEPGTWEGTLSLPLGCRPLPKTEPLPNLGHQGAQGHYLPSGSSEAPLSDLTEAAVKLSRDLRPGTGLGL